MASLAFLSLARRALAPVFKPGLRSFGSSASLFRPQPEPIFPSVANIASTEAGREAKWAQTSQRILSNLANSPVLSPYSGAFTYLQRTNPISYTAYAGRSVEVRGNLADSLKQLDGILARNKVKLQLRMTERHEKKGYKRRRLASERWRNQFANEVRSSV
jgi:small subunit ribosomal protein MRP21